MSVKAAMLVALLAADLAKRSAYLALFPVTINHLQELVFQPATQPNMPLEEAHRNV